MNIYVMTIYVGEDLEVKQFPAPNYHWACEFVDDIAEFYDWAISNVYTLEEWQS